MFQNKIRLFYFCKFFSFYTDRVCMYTSIDITYLHIYVYMYIFTLYTCIHSRICIYGCTHFHIYVYMHVSVCWSLYSQCKNHLSYSGSTTWFIEKLKYPSIYPDTNQYVRDVIKMNSKLRSKWEMVDTCERFEGVKFLHIYNNTHPINFINYI